MIDHLLKFADEAEARTLLAIEQVPVGETTEIRTRTVYDVEISYGQPDPETGEPVQVITETPREEEYEAIVEILGDRPLHFGAVWGEADTYLVVQVVLADAVYSEPDGELVTPAILVPGFWMVVRKPALDADLVALEQCIVATDIDLAQAGQPFILYKREATPWAALTARVEPIFAGEDYPMGPGVGPHLLVI